MGQRAEKGLSLQQCKEIPQKDTATLLNREPSSNNNRGGGVMLARWERQCARIKTRNSTLKIKDKMRERREVFALSKN